MLPVIPVIYANGPGDLLDKGKALFTDIIACTTKKYPILMLKTLDKIVIRWMRRHQIPQRHVLEAMAKKAELPGLLALNLIFEWACTTATGKIGEQSELKMIRILDWNLRGLGKNIAVCMEKGPAGEFLNVTWPGFYGVVTASAPGRFALALNQAPLRRRTSIEIIDKLIAAALTYRNGGMPLSIFLRDVMEKAPTYSDAVRMITDPNLRVASPGLITLTGLYPGEACIIERSFTHATVHQLANESAISVANDWMTYDVLDWPRSFGTPYERRDNCQRRRDSLLKQFSQDIHDFSWIAEPILNENMRAAFVTCPATGECFLQGFEPVNDDLPVAATALLCLNAKGADIAYPS